LFSFICLTHGDNVSDAVALRVDNNHGAATKDPETNRPHFIIVSSSIGDLNRGAREDALRIEEVQASLLEGAQALAGIKADHHAAWQGPSCSRGQQTWIVIASGRGMLNEQVPRPVTPPAAASRPPQGIPARIPPCPQPPPPPTSACATSARGACMWLRVQEPPPHPDQRLDQSPCGTGCCLANPAPASPGGGPHRAQEPWRLGRPQQPAGPLLLLQYQLGWRCTSRNGTQWWSC